MAEPTRGVLVMGGINKDLVAVSPHLPGRGETVVGVRFFTTPGGKGANQAVAVARMGVPCWMVGRVGDDPFGRELRRALRDNGVDTRSVVRDMDHASGVAVIGVEEGTGQNRIINVKGANGAVGKSDVRNGTRLLRHVGVLLLQLEVPLEASLELARHAQRGGATVVLDPAPAAPLPPEAYHLVNILTPNETEAAALVGHPVHAVEDGLRAARELRSRGASAAVVKMGANGAVYASAHGDGHLWAHQAQVVDTVAAGDAFNGALAAALAWGEPLTEALRWAMAAGAVAVTRRGAQQAMPSQQDVAALVETHG